MPIISNKAIQMPESPIRKLVPFSEIAKAKGKSVFHLNIGQPDIETPEVALNAVKNIDRKVIEYSHSAGFQSYRDKLSKYYKSVNIDISPEDIIITTGGSEALIFAFQCCFEPGDEIIIPEPFYANYNGFATSCGIKVISVTAKIENGFALPPIAEIESKITSKTKGILICNPGNPTGYLYKESEMLLLKVYVKNMIYFYLLMKFIENFAMTAQSITLL